MITTVKTSNGTGFNSAFLATLLAGLAFAAAPARASNTIVGDWVFTNFPLPAGWSAASTGGTMSIADTNTAG